MGITGDYTVKIQECKVKATGDLRMKPSGTYFYKFYMNLPKYMSNALGLAGGERMYLSRTDDDVCALSRKWHGDSDIPVTLSESVTRRYNGRKYTIAQAKAIRSLRQKILQSVVLHPSLALPMALVCPKKDQY